MLDNHIHLQPKGRGVEAIKEFSKAGGTHAILSHMPYDEVFIKTSADFMRSYQITLEQMDLCNRETPVKMFCTVGPYPVLLIELAKDHGLVKAKEMMMEGMDQAAHLVEEGRAVAIGEVGRPHFPVGADMMEASNEILAYGMRLCKELGCAIVVHAESATPSSMGDLGRIADAVGLPRDKVVKHFCAPLVLPEESRGLMPSVLASKNAVQEALSKGDRFLLETDYMDDPARPGAVLGIATVPKRIKGLLLSGAEGGRLEDALWKINKDNPERTYGIDIR
ncbi:MAG: TatD family hydrolase [Methanomassiliicoccales archaeon]|nr:MAG: TatD family hydrolase [Methanomassiliicoccales archaeon]